MSHGPGGVPTWFVHTDDLIQARSDEVVTRTELQALEPLIGTATFFTETLHPAESAKPPLLVINAEGTLTDGRFFSMHVTLNESNDLRRVRTTFGH